jgi:hypothetical protein
MEQEQKIHLKAKDDDLKGNYSNIMQVVHSKEEVILDFFLNAPPEGILVSRLIMSPGHAKRVAMALSENIKKYEDKYGKIQDTEIPEEKIGFVK